MAEFFKAKLCDNSTFEAIYLKFEITDLQVLLCQINAEYLSMQTGLVL